MVAIPAGSFDIGSEQGPGDNIVEDDKNTGEGPVDKVSVDAFEISKTPVTVKQFKMYCAAQEVDFSKFLAPPRGWIDDHPMVSVSWADPRSFYSWAGVISLRKSNGNLLPVAPKIASFPGEMTGTTANFGAVSE